MKKLVVLLLILVVSVTACKRKNVRGDLKNRRDMLEASNWKLINITGNGGMTSLPPCQQDNYYEFIPGSSGKYHEGAINCLDSLGTGNAPTYTPFLWQMTGDLRYIYFMDYGGDPDARFQWEILNMTFDKLDVRQRVVENGIDVRLDMTFVAISK
ncbi:MAG: hypothetical protein KDC07_00505 [Chitinophagaceae bacterium]|nr:hypothetical protein [Chitinophagaceae bacterium]MCB9046215.1 hypothetical protein [Chitinophagales bacterium]